jgi:hypothetical protein
MTAGSELTPVISGGLAVGETVPVPFRSYSPHEFIGTSTWAHLTGILATNGGAYGLYGPRGSGKTWLMRHATEWANGADGMGLWFPCPSGYDASAFLGTLSDTLATEVERRYLSLGRRALAKRGPAAHRLVREAAAVRERIRYSTALKRGSEIGITGVHHVTGSFRRTREKDLDERPTTVASLVFGFRRLAAAITTAVPGPLVIGIDELDKIDDPNAVRALLRDIKAIFEIPGAFFLVSVSDEAAVALQLGPLRGRDEFNSSFYTVLDMPPLDPAGVQALAQRRNTALPPEQARMLCLLGAGNWRETIRLAGQWRTAEPSLVGPAALGKLTRGVLAAEAAALLWELIRAARVPQEQGTDSAHPPASAAASDEDLADAWHALPAAAFEAPDTFDELSRYAIRHHWNRLGWPGAPAEAWRRYLVRLFVVGRALAGAGTMTEEDIIDLRDVLISAGYSATVALLMLYDMFGADLAGPHRKPRRGQLWCPDFVTVA